MAKRGKRILAPSLSVGAQSAFPDTWPLFVQAVLEVTVGACCQMSRAAIVQPTWDEDTYTINLVDYMRIVAQNIPLSLQIQPQIPVYTKEMKAGKETHKKAGKIDIQLWDGRWTNYDRIYFAWECKLIVDKAREKKQDRLIPEYISRGIARFIDGKYSRDVAEAGMLGYALAGSGADIAQAINQTMLASRHKCEIWKAKSSPSATSLHEHLFTESDQLVRDGAVEGFSELFLSNHSRTVTDGRIKLHHAFLAFPIGV